MERDAEAEIDHALFPPGADGRAGGAQITHPAVGEVHDRREGDVPPDADVVARADSEAPPRAGDGPTIAQVVVGEPEAAREEEASRRGGVVIDGGGDVANTLLEAATRFVPSVDGAAQKYLWAECSAKLEETRRAPLVRTAASVARRVRRSVPEPEADPEPLPRLRMLCRQCRHGHDQDY